MKKYLALILCSLAISAQAQNVQDVINAEKAFATYAKDHNTRDAFVKYMADDGVVFNNGEPKNAMDVWKQQAGGTTKLLWESAFAGIASSGELAFTTGPWQFKKTMQDTALASGIFTSIWRKGANGEWKNIVDMGYALSKPAYKTPQIRISKTGTASAKTAATPIEIDEQFIAQYNKAGKAALNDILLPDTWLNMNSLLPFTTAQQHADAIAAIPEGLVMKPLGGGIAKDNDLAYVYGSVQYKTEKENYLRVWKQTPAGWKLALQVLLW